MKKPIQDTKAEVNEELELPKDTQTKPMLATKTQ